MKKETKTTRAGKERYDPGTREKYWQIFWEKERTYEFNPENPGPVYTVDTPPPTISGALHLGHIFSYIQAEVIARFQRMDGANIRYPQGFDNNGLPTERLTEKEIGKKGHEMKLEEFIKACLETTSKYKKIYEDLWKSIGLSVDWRLEYSTISAEVQKMAQLAFKELYEKGIIYKRNAPALFCTECRTSFAQAEKEDKEVDSIFFDLKFAREDGQYLIISTTRPELLPACVAVFVNPQDKRYKDLIGQKAKTPLGREVPVLADKKAEIEKGSGAVMCCTYGDETDIYWAKTYELPERIILGKSGKLQNVSDMPELNGLNPKAARKLIIKNLKKEGFVADEEGIRHSVGIHERCGMPIEFLSTTQWFVKMLDMKDELLKAGNRINWHPAFMKKRYEEWVSGLKWDWCISRERFYGIPIPVFNCDTCDQVFIPDEKDFPVDPKTMEIDDSCPHCQGGKLIPERSVLDTWFTSSLTPDINNDHELNGPLKGKLYPMSLRPMGHDIIRTWAVYTILISLYRHQEIPWENLMISGHILMRKGEKISKKTGGGKYKPEDLIAKETADAVRYAMFGAMLGRDAYFDEKEVKKGRKLVTKIYNAGKLVLSNLQDFDPKSAMAVDKPEAFDEWIIRRCAETLKSMRKAFQAYEYTQARRVFEQFFWSDFCDNYLEIAKGRFSISADDEDRLPEKLSAQRTAYQTFLSILKMASPFIPHITEEMYHAEIKAGGENTRESLVSESGKGYYYRMEGVKSIHNTKWPSDKTDSAGDVTEGATLALQIIAEARKFKTMNKIRFGASVSRLTIKCPEEKQGSLKPFLQDIAHTIKAQETSLVAGPEVGVSITL